MCTDTKGRIAEAVEQMLQTRPVCKITVQRVMEQAQMKRQSFYYHYQDNCGNSCRGRHRSDLCGG